jgi:predicted HTH transcriptional regulator
MEYKDFRWPIKSNNNEYDAEFKLKRAICAFLNTKGGTIMLGIHDDDLKVVGMDLNTK